MDSFQSIAAITLYVLPIMVFVVGVYFTRRFVRSFERRVELNTEIKEMRARVAELEDSHEVLERDVLRLQAANEFAVQLLGARLNDASQLRP